MIEKLKASQAYLEEQVEIMLERNKKLENDKKNIRSLGSNAIETYDA